jgi:FkbM family methyltransferase
MAPDPGGPLLPDHLSWYTFWARSTAAQAAWSDKSLDVVDRRVRRFFHEACRAVQPTVVLELGAHEGRFSRWAKREFPDAQCLALEANPYVYRKHRDRLQELGVDYRHLAAASTNGMATINIPTQLGESMKDRDNRMASLAIHRADRAHEAVEVEAARVDDLVRLADDDRVVAWIDVEGASDAVLAGSREVLARTDAVYIEVETEEVWPGQWLDVDVARFLLSLGMFPAVRDLQRPHQYNVVFLSARLGAEQGLVERAARVLRHPKSSDGASRAD